MGKCSLACLSFLVLIVALILQQLLTPPVVWHEGPIWEEFLTLYDALVAQHFGACTARAVETTFGSTQVYACGDPSGPPVVAQGGAGSSCVIYTDWILPKLVERGHFVLAVDFVCDVGRSRPRDGNKANCPKTQDDLVSWLQQILAAYGITKPASLMGYSYGAFISALTAVKAPASVDKVVMMAPAAIFADVSGAFIFRAIFHTLVYAGQDGFALEDWMHVDPNFRFAKNLTAAQIRFQRAVKGASLLSTTLVPNHHFSDEELRVLALHPCLVIVGENETVIDVEVAKQTVSRHPEIDTRVYPNSGHLLIIEEHRQRAEDEIVEFLSTTK